MCGVKFAASTRNGRILFSFGNWIGVCADHCSRGHVPGCFVFKSKGRLIALGRRQMHYSWWIVRDWDVGSGPFRGRPAAGGVGVKMSCELDCGVMHGLPCAPAPLRRVQRNLPDGGGGNAKRAIYTGVQMLEKHPNHCHLLPLFAVHSPHSGRTLALYVESAPEDRDWPKRFPAPKKPRGSDRRKLPLGIAATVHYHKPKSLPRFSVPDLLVWRGPG